MKKNETDKTIEKLEKLVKKAEKICDDMKYRGGLITNMINEIRYLRKQINE